MENKEKKKEERKNFIWDKPLEMPRYVEPQNAVSSEWLGMDGFESPAAEPYRADDFTD